MLRRPAVCKKTRFPDEKRKELENAATSALEALTGALLSGRGFPREKRKFVTESPSGSSFCEKTFGREQLWDENLRVGRVFLQPIRRIITDDF